MQFREGGYFQVMVFANEKTLIYFLKLYIMHKKYNRIIVLNIIIWKIVALS